MEKNNKTRFHWMHDITELGERVARIINHQHTRYGWAKPITRNGRVVAVWYKCMGCEEMIWYVDCEWVMK
jgi:hypothetical protein